MTAMFYRWFLGLSGADLAVGGIVLAVLSVIAAWALWLLGAWLWSLAVEWNIRRRVASAWKRQAPWPVPFVERPVPHRDPWPLVTVIAFAALVVAIWARCGAR